MLCGMCFSPDRGETHPALLVILYRRRAADDQDQRNERTGSPRSAAGGAGRAPKADTGRRSRQPAAKDEDPGLVLISRRPPQQKFTNFEEYMNAHGGATAPIEDHSDEV